MKKEPSQGYQCQGQTQEKGNGWFSLSASLSAREAQIFIYRAGLSWGQSLDLLWAEAASAIPDPFPLQSGCFPSKQHCSAQIRRDLQCREKPPTRHSAACGLRAELGAAVPLCFNCSGSTVLLSVPSSLGHYTASSGSACGSGTCQVVPWIVECCPGTMEVLV